MAAIIKTPSLEEKIEILGGEARFDLSCGTCGEGRKRSQEGGWIYPSIMPDGRTQYMLKTLMTNACKNNCSYCAIRANRSVRRASFSPEEMAALFARLLSRRLVSALFLSSGMPGDPVAAMDKMLACAEIVRNRLRFKGYMHLKILPGAETSQIERALELAERVSVNLEAPSDERLKAIAPQKSLANSLVPLLNSANKLMQNREGRLKCRGLTTQFVVGAAGESDVELVRAGGSLYESFKGNLKRIYFSAFSPIPETPLEGREAAPLWRENRLYQADFLLREYGFTPSELVFEPNGNFCRDKDPKQAWADAHLERFPVEVNSADYETLIRTPGIGAISAKRIIAARKSGKIKEIEDLKKLGAQARRAAEYLLFDGKRKVEAAPKQGSLDFAPKPASKEPSPARAPIREASANYAEI